MRFQQVEMGEGHSSERRPSVRSQKWEDAENVQESGQGFLRRQATRRWGGWVAGVGKEAGKAAGTRLWQAARPGQAP